MYVGRKKKIMERGRDIFMERGVRRQDAVLTSFVKAEKVKPASAPRVINPRNVVYNVALGVYIKPIEHIIYRKIQKLYGSVTPVVFKGLNVDDMGLAMLEKWRSFNDPVAVGLDAMKFDMHVSAAMLAWEHSIYKRVYPGSRDLQKLLRWQIKNVGRGYCFDGTLKYHILGRRCSGDMNTALGNCIIMTGMIYSWVRLKQIKIELANNGDDAVVILERKDVGKLLSGIENYFLTLGFRITVEPAVDVFEQIEFCQMHPVVMPTVCRMVRNFTTSREKDTIALLDIGKPLAYAKWMGAVGEGGLALCSGIPVLQSFYHAYARVGVASNIINAVQMQCGALFLRIGMQAKIEPVRSITRSSFYAAFGITPDEQVSLEEYYDKISLKFGGEAAIDNLLSIPPSPF